jgi:flagellar biosynthesis protein FlhB
MEENEQDRSEQATPYKLEKARKKGVVARGGDLGFFAALTMLGAYGWIEGDAFGAHLRRSAHNAFVDGPQLADGQTALISATYALVSVGVAPLLLILVLVFGGVLLAELLQTGVIFSAEPLRFDFSRLNPANGFRRVFSARMLVETLKSILKLAVYTALAVLVIRYEVRTNTLAIEDGPGLARHLFQCGLFLLGAFILAAAFFAVLDQIIARRLFGSKMRMSRRELRREVREREGEPRLKQKRRQLHREFVRTRQSVRNLRKADVLVTNPLHIAVGLKYTPKVMPAPTVVAIGVDHVAQRLRRMALLYSIPVVENRALAHALYQKAPLNKSIPRELYRAVADIYNALRKRAAA